MAEKDSKPKATAKKVTDTATPAATPKQTAKPAAKTEPAATPKQTAKPAATSTAKAEAKPAAKSAPAKPAAQKAGTKPTVNKTESNGAPKATAKAPAASVKAEKAKPETKAQPAPATSTAKAEVKPAAKTAPKEQPKKVKPAASVTGEKQKSKPAKAEKTKKSNADDGGKKGGAAAISKSKIRIIAIAAAAFVMILALVIGVSLGVNSCANSLPKQGDAEFYDTEAYGTSTTVGYSTKITGKVATNKPVAEEKNESAVFDSEATGSVFANGAARYPTYGSTLKHVIGEGEAQVAARSALISEFSYLCAWGTRGANNGGEQTADKYTKIDKDGYLYQNKNNEWIHSLLWGKSEYITENYRQLYKHTAAQGMYLEGKERNGVTYEISDGAERVVKEVSMRPRGYSSYGITGLYAPAGEVIKIELSGRDMNATGGITVHIGQALYNGQANNIWVSKNQMQRIPYILTTLVLNKSTCEYDEATDTYTGYVGSFVGGPIYIRNSGASFKAKISGGLEYLHFILGYTTEAEYNRLKQNSRVPMFDMEVWNYGVLHSGPRYYAETFTYEDIYKAAVLWDKVASVTTTGSNQGIVFLYDPFVAAGAAVAFPGRSSVNNPLGWMSASLNYQGLVTSGSWGNFHEYHHNFQNYGLGVGADGEVTNNALTLVSYSLFTKISSKRGMSSYGGQGLGGWNNYTSATWALNSVNAGQITSTNGLAVYSTLLHNFGQDAFIKARGARGKDYLDKWAEVTRQDFSYYAKQIGAYADITPKTTDYPLFVPVSSVYQTGRSYMYGDEKRDIKTMQPYVIPYGKEFKVDLRPYSAPEGQYKEGSVVIGNGFTYRIKGVTQPENGKLEKTDVEGVYTYTPDKKSKQLLSGQIRVTLEITATADNKTYANSKIDDVDLILEFEQSHETAKMTLERTTYTYAADAMYKDAVEAYNNGFKGHTNVVEQDQFNPTQNCNTDIWFRPNTEAAHKDYPNDPDKYFVHDNTIEVIDGKLYFDEDGKYRVYLRGRDNCALYFSLDGKEYTLGAKINESSPAAPSGKTYLFRPDDNNTYFDVEFKEGKVNVTLYVNGGGTKEYTIKLKEGKREVENWLYLKEVLIVHSSPNVSFIGVGMRQWTQAMFTVTEQYFKADNKTTVESPEADGYAYTRTSYKDYEGKEVAYTTQAKGSKDIKYFKIFGGRGVPSTQKEISELTESKLIEPTVTEKSQPFVNAYRSSYEFKAEFTSDYFYRRSYKYDYKDNVSVPGDEVTLTNSNYSAPPKNWGWGSFPIENLTDGKTNTYIHTSWQVSAGKPLSLTFDLGEERKINRITFQCRNNNGMLETPKAFTVEGSLDGAAWFDVATFTDAPRNGNVVNADFADTTLRYCRIKISAAHQGNGSYYIVIGEITFTRSNEVLGGRQYTPDDDIFAYKGKWSGVQTESSFGHVYIGANGARMSFGFTGTRIALLSSNAYGKDFKVYIDGKKVDSIELKVDDSAFGVSYMCDRLAPGKHKVEVILSGKSTIDSVVTFDENE